MIRDTKIDWITLLMYLLLIILGWINLYSISHESNPAPVNMSSFHGKQAIWIGASLMLGLVILFLDTKFLEIISYVFYGLCILALIAVLFSAGTKGAQSWFRLGGFKLQPTEFAKVGTILALARFMSRHNFSLARINDLLIAVGIVMLPMGLVVLQNDAGSALIFSSMILVFYREGMHPMVLVGLFLTGLMGVLSIFLSQNENFIFYLLIPTGIMLLLSAWLLFKWRLWWVHLLVFAYLAAIPFGTKKVLKPHQSARLRVLTASKEEIKSDSTLKAVYYNLRHSLVAIGSGGVLGKGYGNSTHTRGDFVPEEHTDYIICVWSEEHGFLGTALALLLFLTLLYRIHYVAENSKSDYARILGYGAMAILGMHFVVNIGMATALLPTVGIPLPFFSYGGSAMIASSMLLFIIMNHYSYRSNILGD